MTILSSTFRKVEHAVVSDWLLLWNHWWNGSICLSHANASFYTMFSIAIRYRGARVNKAKYAYMNIHHEWAKKYCVSNRLNHRPGPMFCRPDLDPDCLHMLKGSPIPMSFCKNQNLSPNC